LETLDNPIYKIASFEIIDLPLIRAAAQTGKPLVISTGMATLEEITDAVETVFATGNQQLTLLKCTSAYPASPKDANLKTMMDLQKRFGCSIGLSDHTTGNTTAIAAVTMGATFIEKHITLDKNNSVDGAFSLEPDQFTEFVTAIRQAEVIPGKIHYGVVGEDKTSYLHRRSLYVVQDIATGELLTPENIRSLRPGLGLSPKHYEQVMGKRAKSFLKRGQPLKKSDV
jgi:sialic acid synthase SpsE